jgi:hypothetical protein
MFDLLFLLVVSHALGDFALQSDRMARGKNRHAERSDPDGVLPEWYYWMTAHAIIHGGGVALVTNSPALGIAEVFLHWLIDFGKCDKRYGFHTDQLLHICCKVAWAWLAISYAT